MTEETEARLQTLLATRNHHIQRTQEINAEIERIEKGEHHYTKEEWLEAHVAELFLNETRIANALEGAGIERVGQLVCRTKAELLAIPNLSHVMFRQIVARLEAIGFSNTTSRKPQSAC